jgi:4-amino-4-deoxy-L-arabinose transferase-like glycosyltransferase
MKIEAVYGMRLSAGRLVPNDRNRKPAPSPGRHDSDEGHGMMPPETLLPKVERRQRPVRPDFWVLFLLASALVLRIFLAYRFRFAVSFDEAHYLRLAAAFLQHGPFALLHPYWPPFFPLVIAVFKLPVGNLETAGRLVNILAGCLTVALVYRMARELFSRREALISAAFMAFYPPVAFHSTNVMPESLFSLLALAGIVFGWKALRRKRLLPGLAAGLLWGAAYLVKPEGIGFLAVFLVFTLLYTVARGFKNGGWKRLPAAIAAGLGFVIVALPYWLYLHEVTGKWTLSTKGSVNQQLEVSVAFQDAANPDPFYHLTVDNRHLPVDMAYHFGTLRELSGLQARSGRVVAVTRGRVAQKYVRNFYHTVKDAIPGLLTLVPFVLFVCGLTGSVYGRRRSGFFLFVLANLAFFWFLVIPMFHLNERYFLPLLPVCLVWMGRGAVSLTLWVSENMEALFSQQAGQSPWTARFAAACVVFFILGFGFFPEAARFAGMRADSADLWADPVELKRAGEWIRSQSDHPASLMDVNKAVDFYAGQYDIRKGASFSYDPVDRNLIYARHRGAEYMVFSSRYLSWYPNLRPLIEKKGLPAGLTLVYESDQPAGVRTVVYRVAGADSLPSSEKGTQ